MPRVVKRSASQAVKAGSSRRSRSNSPRFRSLSSPAFPAGREAPLGAAMGARNKVGRLSHGRTDREWSCATADPDRPRLDGQISKRRRGTGEPERQDRLHRRRALRRRRRGTAKLRTDERGVHLVYYAFDLLHIGGWDVSGLSLIERKALLEPLVSNKPGLQFNGHDTGDGELILQHAGKLGFEGVVSKTIDAPYAPGNRGLWRKAKALNRQEFVVVGWSDPEGTRPISGLSCWVTTPMTASSITPDAWGTGMPVALRPAIRKMMKNEGVRKICRPLPQMH
jgi:hypothetical protein